MYSIRKISQVAAAAAALMLSAGAANAILVSAGSNNPLDYSWSRSTVAGILSGNVTMTLSGFNSNALTVTITLNNTSALSSNRLTSFGFGIDPNATGVTFNDGSDGGIIAAGLSSIPSLAQIDVCTWGGSNCAGGGSGGLNGGTGDSFSVTLAGTWGSSVNIDPIGFKYQTGAGSFEFTTATSSNSTSTTTSSGNLIPEPSAISVVGLGLTLMGLAAARRRRQQ